LHRGLVSSTSNCRAARGRQADANHPARRICDLQLSKIALVSNAEHLSKAEGNCAIYRVDIRADKDHGSDAPASPRQCAILVPAAAENLTNGA
jgi:hypothetical protein